MPYVKLVIHHLKMSSWNRRENERESNYIKIKKKIKKNKNKGRKKQFVEKEKEKKRKKKRKGRKNHLFFSSLTVQGFSSELVCKR